MLATLTQHVANATITLAIDGPDIWQPFDKVRMAYTIALPYVPNGEPWESGRCAAFNDLSAPVRDSESETLTHAYVALLGFLSAAGEAHGYPGSDNADMFPIDVMSWAHHYADDITSEECDLRDMIDEHNAHTDDLLSIGA